MDRLDIRRLSLSTAQQGGGVRGSLLCTLSRISFTILTKVEHVTFEYIVSQFLHQMVFNRLGLVNMFGVMALLAGALLALARHHSIVSTAYFPSPNIWAGFLETLTLQEVWRRFFAQPQNALKIRRRR